MNLDAGSLLRLIPDELEPSDVTGHETLEFHLQRYRFAARYARPGRLLDIACGVGYGTRLLADEAPVDLTALGVDLSSDAVAYAQERYAGSRIHYQAADAQVFEDPGGFDTIVSLETIEHLPDPVRFIDRMVSLLNPGGVFVASVPTTPSIDVNPHHLHDFTERSFRGLFRRHGLIEVDSLPQVQSIRLWSLARRSERRMKEIRPDLVSYYGRNPTAFMRRVWATLRYGLSNHYLTIAWRREG